MSTTGDRRFRFPRWRAFGLLMAKPPTSRDGYVEQAVKTFKVIGSPAYPMNEERFRGLVGRAYDRSFHPPGVARQLHAVNCSGNRTRRAARASMLPALVIHGDGRSAGAADRRQGDREGDPGRAAADDRGDGPRPSPRGLHRDRRRDEIDVERPPRRLMGYLVRLRLPC